jgi:hypothetical protein
MTNDIGGTDPFLRDPNTDRIDLLYRIVSIRTCRLKTTRVPSRS